jgi:hypothetical protein
LVGGVQKGNGQIAAHLIEVVLLLAARFSGQGGECFHVGPAEAMLRGKVRRIRDA